MCAIAVVCGGNCQQVNKRRSEEPFGVAVFRQTNYIAAVGARASIKGLTMRTGLQMRIDMARKLGACVCLLAIFILWTPLWAAAWQANGMACCQDGQCPATLHKQAMPAPPAASEPSAECEHHKGSGSAMACSMSCCHQTETSLAATAIFVLPARTAISYFVQATSGPEQIGLHAFVPSFEPLSPPPRVA
jgi:hypothetical protein